MVGGPKDIYEGPSWEITHLPFGFYGIQKPRSKGTCGHCLGPLIEAIEGISGEMRMSSNSKLDLQAFLTRGRKEGKTCPLLGPLEKLCQYLECVYLVSPQHHADCLSVMFATGCVTLGLQDGEVTRCRDQHDFHSHYWHLLVALEIQFICYLILKINNSGILLSRCYRNDNINVIQKCLLVSKNSQISVWVCV